jgi:hypothetical protein
LPAVKGKKLDEFAMGWSFLRNRRMDLWLTGGFEWTVVVAAALFMVCVPTSMQHVGTWRIPWRIIYRYSFVFMLSKREMCAPEIRDAPLYIVSPFASYVRCA